MPLSFRDYIYLGSDQWRVMKNPLSKAFFRLLGPLGVHARIRNTRLLNMLLSLNLDLNNRAVVDVGSGYGYSLHWLARCYPKAHLIGYELDGEQVSQCHKMLQSNGLSNLHFIQGTVSDIRERNYFDLAITIDVLEHVPEDVQMLRDIAAVLRPGGVVLIHVPLRHQLQKRIFSAFKDHRQHDHVRDEYLSEEICSKLETAGFHVEHLEYGFGTLGELAFELNNLFWNKRILRNFMALVFWPVSIILGYIDSKKQLRQGNSILLIARKPSGT